MRIIVWQTALIRSLLICPLVFPTDNVALPSFLKVDCPVVFVVFGSLPIYLELNVELASRKNSVVVLTDSVSNRNVTSVPLYSSSTSLSLSYLYFSSFSSVSSNITPKDNYIVYEPIQLYLNESKRFEASYRHLCKDRTALRKLHEMRCIQRYPPNCLKFYLSKVIYTTTH